MGAKSCTRHLLRQCQSFRRCHGMPPVNACARHDVQVATDPRVAMAVVGVQLDRSAAGMSAAASADGRHRVQDRPDEHAVVPIGAGDRHVERWPGGVDGACGTRCRAWSGRWGSARSAHPSRPDADGVEAGARPVQAVGLAEPVEHRLMEPKAMLLSTSRSEGRGRPVRPWTAGARGGISGSTSAHSSSPIGRGGRGRRRRRHDPDPAPIHLSATEPEDPRPQRLPSPGLVLSRCGSAGRRRCAITS